jgi:anti-sigma B factor antagonist
MSDSYTAHSPAGRLSISRANDSEGVVLALVGELDLETTPELDHQLREVGRANSGRVLIDLRALDFMDSTGLGAIVSAQRVAESNGHRLTLRRGQHQVQRLFELTGVLERFTFED